MHCTVCGQKLDDDEKFCPKCGIKIIREEQEECKQIVEESKNHHFRRKKIFVISGIIVLFILIVVIVFINSSNKNKKGILETKKSKPVESINDEGEEKGEYIFPNSHEEYLMEDDLENLTVEELGFARNEIIARHGRIYNDEKYKTYFESKSWYEGTITAETFDANYENELNEVEKANIELIRRYERKEDMDLEDEARKYYGSFLEYYRNQEKEGFIQTDLELINSIFSNFYFYDGLELYYTIIDMANDGIPELFISDKKTIYGAFGLFEDDKQVFPLVSPDMGDGVRYYICENNMLKEEFISGGSFTSRSYLKVFPHEHCATYVENINRNDTEYYWGRIEGNKTSYLSEASEQDYIEMGEKYPLKKDIKWLKLSEFTKE